MSTAPTAPPPALDVSGTPSIPFLRLVRVEWRKMLDTRGGFWLLASTAILIGLTMAVLLLIVALNDTVILFDAGILAQVFTYPISLLVPVFCVLIVTSEWGQRTAMVTFSLEPKRGKVVAAKLVAVALLAVAALALAVIIGSFTNFLVAAVDGYDPVWDLSLSRLLSILLVQLAFYAMAFALGTLLLNTPAAIAIYYVLALVLPFIMWPILFNFFGWARDVLPWIEINTASGPLTTGTNYAGEDVEVGATQYLQFATSSALWVLTPLAGGIARLLRAEVK